MKVNARSAAVQQVWGQWCLMEQKGNVRQRGDSKEGGTCEKEVSTGFISATEVLKELGNTVTIGNLKKKCNLKLQVKKKRTVQDRKCNYNP